MGIYKELGVKTYINAMDAVSAYGGSLPLPAVMDAMEEASRQFVRVADLQSLAGEYIAKITHNEGACVVSGVSGGMMLCAIALMTGGDRQRLRTLPDSSALRNQVVCLKAHGNAFEREISCVGAHLVAVEATSGQLEPLRAAIGEKTCAIFCAVGGGEGLPTVEEILAVGTQMGIPVVINASGQLPPKENLWRFTHMGAVAAVFSGAEALRGPTGSGLVVGQAELMRTIRSIAPPKHGIGAPAGIGREQIAGLCVAVECFMAGDDFAHRIYKAQRMIRDLSHVIEKDGYFLCHASATEATGLHAVRLTMEILGGYSAEALTELLAQGEPSVLVERAPRADCANGIALNLLLLQEEQIQNVLKRIRECAEKLTLSI